MAVPCLRRALVTLCALPLMTGCPTDDPGGPPYPGDDDDDDAHVVSSSDWDGDGVSDLAVYDRADGLWWIRTMEGELLVDGAGWGYTGCEPLPADFDGDGRTELSVHERFGGAWWAQTMDAELLLGPQLWGWLQTYPAPGDYDGDGADEVAVYAPRLGQWYITTVGGETLAYEEPFGTVDGDPVVCDYDGDGRDDLALYDRLEQVWDIRTLSGTILASGLEFGFPGAVPVPADYDGDGDCDPALWDRQAGTWDVMTLEGDSLLVDHPFGPADGTVPVPGDYDGDGRADLAIYDRTTYLWHVRTVDGDVLADALEFGTGSVIPAAGRFARGGSRIVDTGTEVDLGPDGRYTTIAVDGKDQAHAAMDVGGAPYVAFYDRVDRQWSELLVNVQDLGSTSNQYYNPHLEIDAHDRAWTSGILFGGETGLAFIVRTGMASEPSAPAWSRKHVNLNSWDTGMSSVDWLNHHAVGSSSDGHWQKYTYDPAAEGWSADGERGQMYVGPGGEKNGFVISRAGNMEHADGTTHQVWHGNTIGCGGECLLHNYYQNSVRHAQGHPPVVWADTYVYNLGDDHNYPGQAADLWEPETAYLYFDDYDRGIGLNIWRDGALVFPADDLLIIPGAVADARFAPQGAAAQFGGLYITWSVDPPDAGPTLYIAYVSPSGEMDEPIPFGAGWVPALVTDSEGAIHMVYLGEDGRQKYRKMLTY